MAYVEEKESMDAAASSQTQYNLFVGDSFKGIFSDNLDKDWVRVELVAGKTYQISLSGAGSNSGADTILTVFNSVGEQVAANDDADFAAGQLNSKLRFSPEASGVYYLSAGAYAGNPTQDHSGDYTLTLVDTEADSAGGRADDVKQEGGAGNDVLRGGAGDDVLRGGAGDDVLRGGAGNDNLYGLGGQDFLTGDSGDDLLEGGDDADLLLGDGASAFFAGALVADGDGPDSGSSGGSSRADMLAFLNDQLHAGNDRLNGGAGDDWLEGGPGDDELSGGDDDDLLIGDTLLMTLFAALSVVVLNDDLVGSADFTSPANSGDEDDGAIDNLLLMLLIGRLTAGDDTLDGGPGDDYLDGGFGNDRLVGGTGVDYLEGGPGDDELDAGSGDDYLRGGPGADRLDGGSGDDWLEGSDGDDVLDGGDGNDLLTGDDFPFFLLFELERGGADADGPVVYDPCAGADAVGAIMGVGDYADGPSAGYDPYVSSLTSVLAAWGDDTLSGGAGDDLLAGGPGDDRLSGGPGADVFIFAPAGGYDVVTDFRAGEDKIDLSAFAGIDSTDGLALQQQGDDLIIDLAAHGGGEITLQGFNETDLADAHFIFSAGDDPMAIA